MSVDAELATLVRDVVRDTVRGELEALSDRPLVVTPDEAARLLSLSRRTVDRLVSEGVLPRVPHTSRTLIPRMALETFVNEATA